ncbi:LLM class F420-dependent oxidoreductase [Nocardia sp. NPDC050378]|uniref:LLM class F420-dependent oxidoreductase n=1 Tax=Nocardia sp. NPDC050378 TaxID=3155400 RepID=UPI0033DAFAC8
MNIQTENRPDGHLGGIGIYESALRFGDSAEAADCAAEIESLGYTAVWIPDVEGDLFGAMENLLSGTREITVASGVMNLWMHDADDSSARYNDLVKQYGPRIIVGIGASHAPFVDSAEAQRYRKPLTQMRRFLDELDRARPPLARGDRVLAALGPKMLELARHRSAGAHTYLVTPEHTAAARAVLGTEPLLVPEQGVVLESDPVVARAIARQNIALYFDLPNYVNNWRRYGFGDDDVAAPGSDRLIDALVAWGDESAIIERIQEHRAAGADHVCLQLMIDRPDATVFPRDAWRRLAPALAEI